MESISTQFKFFNSKTSRFFATTSLVAYKTGVIPSSILSSEKTRKIVSIPIPFGSPEVSPILMSML